MSNTKAAKGTCLCGEITIDAPAMNMSLGVCHCDMCRKWSAGPFLAVDCGTDVTVSGSDHLGIYNSSEWAERGFCKNCGSTMFYRMIESQQYMVSSEIFDQAELTFDHQIFIDEKPTYYSFSDKTINMTGGQVLAAFASKD